MPAAWAAEGGAAAAQRVQVSTGTEGGFARLHFAVCVHSGIVIRYYLLFVC